MPNVGAAEVDMASICDEDSDGGGGAGGGGSEDMDAEVGCGGGAEEEVADIAALTAWELWT